MNSVYSKVTINGSEIELHSESPSQLVEMIKAVVGVPTRPVAAAPTAPVAVEKRPVGRPRGKKRRATIAWTPEALSQLVTFAREHGVGNKKAATTIAKRMASVEGNLRSKSTLEVMAYRVYRYLTIGATYGLSKKNLRDLQTVGAFPNSMAQNPGYLGNPELEARQIPVHSA